MEEFTIYCTPKQTRKALDLGAPIQEHGRYHADLEPNIVLTEDRTWLEVPTAEQMMGWLRTKGFGFGITEYIDHVFWRVANNQDKKWYRSDDTLKDPKDAVLAAIDAALEYLIEKKDK